MDLGSDMAGDVISALAPVEARLAKDAFVLALSIQVDAKFCQ
ncbi:hypothetical protein BF49_6742 [Bradyrhizobium sp.]|nr:hypothetical protein BF49_6742 [Bradyrhizobium sp.]